MSNPTAEAYNKVKLTPERKQNKAQTYSSVGEWKVEIEPLSVEKPPVAVLVIE